MNLIYKIARYEQVNNEDFLVAFNVQADDCPPFYIESVLPLNSVNQKTSQEVCQLAYENIKDNILNTINRLKLQSSIQIGSEFIPL